MLPLLPTVILPALIPVLADGLKTMFRWFFGGTPAEPINMDERVKLIQAETEKLRVIAELDKPYGNVSGWVADLRASSRYVMAGFILLCTMTAIMFNGSGLTAIDQNTLDVLVDLSASVFSFLFGDRMYFHLRQRREDG